MKKLKRFLKAKKLKVSFLRTKSFQMPLNLTVNGKKRKLYLPNNSTYIELFRDIILDDEYQLYLLKNKQIVNIIDVGANLGVFSMAARIYFPNAVIHSYEPNPANIPILNKNSLQFDFTCFDEAVSNVSGKGNLSVLSQHDTAARISKDKNGIIKLSNLKTIIHRVPNDKIDLLKLDCEGSEFDILKDKNELKKVRYIAMEYHLPLNNPQTKLQELTTILSDNNFKIIFQEDRNACLGIIVAKNES